MKINSDPLRAFGIGIKSAIGIKSVIIKSVMFAMKKRGSIGELYW